MIENKVISKFDTQQVLPSIDMLSQQVRHAWDSAVAQVTVKEVVHYSNVVAFGMGGSTLGIHIIQGVFAEDVKIPITIVNDYSIPACVGKNTLVLLASYSGNTEEVLTVAQSITEYTQHIAVISAGGSLAELQTTNKYLGYVIDPQYNPCNQPRIAVGYTVVGILAILTKLGVITVTDEDIDNVIHYLEGNRELLRDEGMVLAEKLVNAIPAYVASEFLTGNAHTVTNQTNENGKHLAAYFLIPELNHHLMEGLSHPVQHPLHFVFIESQLYHDRNQKRYHVTKQIADKNSIPHSTFIPAASTKLQQAFEVLQWGSYVSFYLAMVNRVDPAPIPWVDFFKDALKKPL